MMAVALITYVHFIVTAMYYAVVKGRPTMVSEIYYGMGCNWLMPFLLVAMAFAFLPTMLDMGGFDAAAFLTCAGLAFVGTAPAYLEEGDRAVHKAGAIVSALASVIWGLATMPAVVAVYGVAAVVAAVTDRRCWLFWCEVCAISCVAAIIALKRIMGLTEPV